MKCKFALPSIALLAFITGATLPLRGFSGELGSDSIVSTEGALHVPEHYRTRYETLGTWSIAGGSDGGAKEMHVVYASPLSIESYRKDGRFPDGTVLVKEVWATATGSMTTGTVSHVTQLKGWFLMTKLSDAKYPSSKLWGDGWGWSWFDADKPKKTSTVDYARDCKGCHLPAQNTDWVYVQGYPPLKGD